MNRNLATLALARPRSRLSRSRRRRPRTSCFETARIVTVDDARPEARALAARGGVIVAVGTEQEIAPFVGPSVPASSISRGPLAVPGFIEGHGHFMGIGAAEMRLKLGIGSELGRDRESGTRRRRGKPAGRLDRGARLAPGEVGFGSRGERRRSSDPSTRSRQGLAENPVVLEHVSGHGVFVNQKAMELSNIDGDTPDPPGGTIVKDWKGNPDGISAGARSGAGEDSARLRRVPREEEGRARREGVPLEGNHELPGCGLLVRHHRPLQEARAGRRPRSPALGHDRGPERRARAGASAVQDAERRATIDSPCARSRR